MMRRMLVVSFLALSFLSPMILMGAVCSRAIDIPIVVTANLPNKESRGPFELDLDAALQQAGIQPQGGQIPPGAPDSITLTHRDKFDLRSEEQIQSFGPRIHSIYINDVAVEANENTLTVSLPPVEVGVATLPANSSVPPTEESKYQKVAEFSGVPSMELGALMTPTWENMGLRIMRDSLREFAMAVQLKTTVKLKAGDPWPKGKLRVRVQFQFTFVLKPI